MGQLVRQVVELEKVDLVVCHNLGGWSVAAWDSIASLGVPMVQVLHDLYLLCTGANLFKNNERCKGQCTLCKHLRSGHAQRAEQVDGVIAVSRFLLARLHAEGFFRNALSPVIFNSGARVEDTVIRLPHGRLTDGEPLRFGYLGPLSPSKGVAWLIEQFKRLPFKASLNIAGRGQADYERELRTLAADCEHIQFVGQQAPEAFYQHIDVAVVPSIWDEPSGAVAVQACAQSVPVIASSRGALLEIVREGENGLLCDPDDPDSLGLAMLRLAGEPSLRQRLACHARASVLPMLDLERMLDSYQAFFHQVLVKRGVRQRLDFAAHPS
jgi:glycosyltransferase involved in cell wall biosynthesis